MELIELRHRSCVWVRVGQISHPCLLSVALVQFGVNTDIKRKITEIV